MTAVLVVAAAGVGGVAMAVTMVRRATIVAVIMPSTVPMAVTVTTAVSVSVVVTVTATVAVAGAVAVAGTVVVTVTAAVVVAGVPQSVTGEGPGGRR